MAAEKTKELFEKYSELLFRYLFRLTKNEDWALDLLQETFIKAHVDLSKGRVIAYEKSWLYKIAYNCFLQELRSKKYDEVEYIDQISAQQTSTFTDQIEWESLKSEIEDSLTAINPVFCAIFRLKIENELNHIEIAGSLGIPERTLRRYLTKISAHISKKFNKD